MFFKFNMQIPKKVQGSVALSYLLLVKERRIELLIKTRMLQINAQIMKMVEQSPDRLEQHMMIHELINK